MTRRNVIDTERKTPAEHAQTFFLTVCVVFTIVMTTGMIFGSIFADDAAQQGINFSWSILAVCVLAAALQFVFFTPALIKRMAYPLRFALFGVCLYAVLAVVAVKLSWFPTDMIGAWISFTVTYLAIFALMTAFSYLEARKESRDLNEKLEEYRSGSARS